jgi:RNA polymerase sigma-70 factor (ECF subfamily)
LTDESLLVGFGAGDPDASLVFVQRFQRAVFGAALAVITDRGLAEDVAQECFVRAWRHAAGYDPCRGTVRAWLVTIARNLAVDAPRVHRPFPIEQQVLQLFIAAITDSPEDHTLADEASTRLREALRGLPDAQARAVVLTAVHGLTAVEVADIERIPLGTAKSRIRAALAKLHASVAESSHP